MKHPAALLGFLVLGAACGSNSSQPPTSPSFLTNLSGSSAGVRQIAVGEEVTGALTVHGAVDVFELTAPSNGTLVVRLSWSPAQGRLELWLADMLPSQSEPPIATKLTVIAGRKYRVGIADSAAWDYDGLFLPYVLTTDIQ
jgi:hypothetical protein